MPEALLLILQSHQRVTWFPASSLWLQRTQTLCCLAERLGLSLTKLVECFAVELQIDHTKSCVPDQS
jgi:hypothetical protein